MKTLFVLLVAFLAVSAGGQTVPIYTADYYRVNPAIYLGKEVTLAVAYVMPSDRSRPDGLQELKANTYNQNRFGGHIWLLPRLRLRNVSPSNAVSSTFGIIPASP
jgi:hypothetical protein